MPTVTELGNRAMRPIHWKRLFTELGHTYYADEPITLKRLRQLQVLDRKELVAQVCEHAIGEHALETAFDKVRKAWESQAFLVVPHKQPQATKRPTAADGKSAADAEMYILGDVEEVTVLLEEHQTSLQTLLGSRFAGPLLIEVRIDHKFNTRVYPLKLTCDNVLTVYGNRSKPGCCV